MAGGGLPLHDRAAEAARKMIIQWPGTRRPRPAWRPVFPVRSTVTQAHYIVSSVKDVSGGERGLAGRAASASRGSGPLALAEPEQPGAAALAAGLLTAIAAVRRTTRRAARQASATEPLPPARSELLRLIARQPGITVAEAAREMRLAPNTVSTMVGDLTAQGLLSRDRSSADGRTVRLDVTARARQRLAQWRDLRADLAARALAGLTDEDTEALARAIPALTRLAEQMETP
jgi:DNA-binding MarR family transcriptional regulator